ncbi:MAG: phosphatase PAP2 family protein [Clostridiales bacterium]|nr:phosphatase PAP2 family protein [Clostridiales bacterium]
MNDGKTLKFNKTAGIICIVMACTFAVTFIIGTFTDKKIAPVLFSDMNLGMLIVSTVGIYIFCAFYAFFFGALFSQAVNLPKEHKKRTLYIVLIVVLGSVTLLICGGSVLDINNLGGIFPFIHRDVPQMIIMLLVGLLPISYIGYKACKKRSDAQLAKHLILVLSAMTVSFFLYELVKIGLPRPRYRLIAKGHEGIEFRRWYNPIKNKAELIAKYGINKDDFKSFPSGHTSNSIMNITLFPALGLVYPKLKEKASLLFVMGVCVGISVLISRMVLGAHFLSDVSCGGFTASVVSAVYYKLYKKIS